MLRGQLWACLALGVGVFDARGAMGANIKEYKGYKKNYQKNARGLLGVI